MSPRIALDARMIGHSGIGTYIRGILSAFTRVQLGTLTLIGDPAKLSAYGCRVEPAFEPIYGPREQWAMARRLARLAPDLAHVPHYNVPALYGGRLVTTVHDVNHLLFPRFARSPFARTYTRLMVPIACRKSRRISADSESTKRDLVRFGCPAEKIEVVLLAADPGLAPVEAAEAAAAVRRLGLEPGYFLYVGNLRPVKNIPHLIRTYGELKRRRADAPPLILAGKDQMDGETAKLMGPGVRHIGEVPAGALNALYGAAAALVFPSIYEGFGLPPLEAMACGCPVITSNGGSLPEVAGDAALIVDPADAAGLAAAMERMFDDAALRQDLRRRGFEQAKRFSWKTAAEKTYALYEEALRS